MESTFVTRNRIKNEAWAGSLRNKGILPEGDYLYTVTGDEECFIESSAVNRVYKEVTVGAKLTGTGRENRRKAVASLLNACFEAINGRIEDEAVGVLWRTSTSYGKRTRYTANVFGSSARKPAVDYLVQHGYITFFKGGKDNASFAPGLISLVLPTDKLEELYDEVSSNDFTIVYAEGAGEELVLLDGANKDLINYEDTEDIIKQRTALRKINELNSTFKWKYESKEKEVVIHERSIVLKRLFKDGSFYTYGRIHCEAQGIPKTHRRTITIDGEETTELDFQCMMPTLAYAETGISSATGEALELKGDVYELEPYSRALVKKAFSISLNTKTRNSAIKALVSDSNLSHKEAGELINSVLRENKKIASYFFSEAWKVLNYHESEIMMSVLSACGAFGVPVLPIHDGVVCRAKDVKRVTEFMVFSFYAQYRFNPIVKETKDKTGRSNERDIAYLER
jgi:hypothetical protein